MNKEQGMQIDIEDLSIAVVHGNYVSRGGGEYVAEAIARTFDAPIYYGFGSVENEPEDIECYSLFNDHLAAPLFKHVFPLRDIFYMIGFRSVPELLEYDVLIQSGNEPGWYKPPEDQAIIKYTHSTPRNAYDRYPYRAVEKGLLFEAYTYATEQQYRSVIPYPDLYIANSEVVERRLAKFWDKKGEDVTVVYPPVEVSDLGSEHKIKSPEKEYYLVLDRLVPTKHVDEIIAAFREYKDRNLIIAGSGSEEGELRRQASDLSNVEFVGYVNKDRKRELLAGAKALVYAAEDEDFGIVPIEAFASGTPVIGPREGFTQFQIDDGRTGLLYDRDGGGIVRALYRFEADGVRATDDQLESEATRYRKDRFKREMREAVATAVDRVRIEV